MREALSFTPHITDAFQSRLTLENQGFRKNHDAIFLHLFSTKLIKNFSGLILYRRFKVFRTFFGAIS